MPEELKVPEMGESIVEGTLVRWALSPGDSFREGETVAEIETDKITMDIPAPFHGTLVKQLAREGETVRIGQTIAILDQTSTQVTHAPKEYETSPASPQKAPPPAPSRPEAKASLSDAQPQSEVPPPHSHDSGSLPLPPSLRRLAEEHALTLKPGEIQGTGQHGRITREDLLAHIEEDRQSPRETTLIPPVSSRSTGEESEERIVPMTPLRRSIAARLVESQHTSAILTTFNDVDMSRVMELRTLYKEEFQKKHGVSPGFTSFFALASLASLRDFPALNAQIRGDTIVYRDYVHLGIAVSGPKGLVVPVIHNAERLSIAGIEREIVRLSGLVRDSAVALSDLQGGTFTITNGGVFGSLLSTPILNPPQSGILGMHRIEKRPVVVRDEIVIRPMMYLALSYDHRLVDGREAVGFLVRIKELIEAPERLLLEI